MAARTRTHRPRRPQDIVDRMDVVLQKLREQVLSPEQRGRAINSLLSSIEEHLRNQTFTPDERRRIADRLAEAARLVESGPPVREVHVPRPLDYTPIMRAPPTMERVTHTYQVSVGGRTYSLDFQLPISSLSAAEAEAIRAGRFDSRMLFNILKDNRFQARISMVDMDGTPESRRFNARGNETGRLNALRDAYLTAYRRDRRSIRVERVPHIEPIVGPPMPRLTPSRRDF